MSQKINLNGLTVKELIDLQNEVHIAKQEAIKTLNENTRKEVLELPKVKKGIEKLNQKIAQMSKTIKEVDGTTIKIPCVLTLKLNVNDTTEDFQERFYERNYYAQYPCDYNVEFQSVDLTDSKLTKKQTAIIRSGVRQFVDSACKQIHALFDEIKKLEAEQAKLLSVADSLKETLEEKNVKYFTWNKRF